MTQTTELLTYSVPGTGYSHCRAAITAQVEKLAGVASVDVNLEAKRVSVAGSVWTTSPSAQRSTRPATTSGSDRRHETEVVELTDLEVVLEHRLDVRAERVLAGQPVSVPGTVPAAARIAAVCSSASTRLLNGDQRSASRGRSRVA